MEQGQSIALVTDAGMPGISDPGARLVSAAVGAGVNVQVVPGPSAVTAALALSGIVEGPFYFLGFLPRQGKERTRAILRITNCLDAVVLFESPHRVAGTLAELASHHPERPAVICRELTKIYEETHRGTLATLASDVGETRGEFVLVLGAIAEESLPEGETPAISDQALLEKLTEGLSPRSILGELAVSGKQRRALYARLLALADQMDPGSQE
jgi:16S rRNA (cytidine1402-2'-O)-methyltransferase